MAELARLIRDRAVELGFERVAFIPAEKLATGDAYDTWLTEGRHGEMNYMTQHRTLRLDPRELEPETATVIALLKVYDPGPDLLDGGLRIARYAHGDDYHDVLRDRMRELAAFIQAETGADVGERPAVDSAPLLERELARSAGLGWIGKNSMLIHPQIGSYTFISELLVKIRIDDGPPAVLPDRCGRCTRCIDRCPTGAIISPQVIDARLCISYLTIELRGPIPRRLRPLIGDHVFGCDLCQDVCPWNSKSKAQQDPCFRPRDQYQTLNAEDLLQMDQTTFSAVFRKSAIKRTKRRGLLRNAAVVLGNRQSSGPVDLLVNRLREEDESLVRGHLAWALGRIGTRDARMALREAAQREADPYVAEEIRFSLDA